MTYYESPLGWLAISSNGSAITKIQFVQEAGEEDTPDQVINQTIEQLNEFFAGQRHTFDLPLAPEGTEFEQKVWEQLQHIPYGATVTYGDISRKLGDPNLMRAVGRANGKNPISIVIPCHRVIGSDNKLTGYAGGLPNKEWLLRHEGALLI